VRRRLVAGALALATLAGCAARQRTPAEVAGQRTPPFPLSSADPHVEPDLVGTTHVVQKGETLYRIARTYGVDPRELMDANGISDPRTLAPGQELFVPGATQPLDVAPAPAGAPAGPQARRPRESPSRRFPGATPAPSCAGRCRACCTEDTE
jgi:lipoprotein NlpD